MSEKNLEFLQNICMFSEITLEKYGMWNYFTK